MSGAAGLSPALMWGRGRERGREGGMREGCRLHPCVGCHIGQATLEAWSRTGRGGEGKAVPAVSDGDDGCQG